MALATRCPHCHTTFRVAHDQLKLRAGLVRCGACKEIFNGIEHLLPQEGIAPPASAAPAPQPPAPVIAPGLQTPPTPAPPVPDEPSAEFEAHSATTDIDTAQPAAGNTIAHDDSPAVAPEVAPDIAPSDEHHDDGASFTALAPPEDEKKPTGGHDAELDIPDFSEFLQMAEAAAQDEHPTEHAPAAPDSSPSGPPEPAHDEWNVTQPRELDPDDPLTRMTLMDFHDGRNLQPPSAPAEPAKPADAGEFDPLEQTIDELQNLPDRRKLPPRRSRNMQKADGKDDADAVDAIDAAEDAADISLADEIEEPSFVRKARFQERFGPLINWTLAIASVLLAVALFAQGVYSFRNQIAARLPKAKPALVKACAWLGCHVTLPMQIDSISIEANELQATGTGKDAFVLNVVLRNRSSLTQAWPNLELTLKDTNGKPLVRRVFLPREYLLDPQDVDRGFASATEQQIKLAFSVAQPDSSGYEVAIFYP